MFYNNYIKLHHVWLFSSFMLNFLTKETIAQVPPRSRFLLLCIYMSPSCMSSNHVGWKLNV